MRGVIVIVVTVLCLLPTAIAPPPAAENGLARACQQAQSAQPCTLLGDVTVGLGETQTYSDGTYVANTIVVEAGGTVVVENATLRFTANGDGILVETGGALHVFESTIEPRESGSEYRLDLAPASSFILNLSTVRGGTGVKLATSDADVAGNSFEGIPLALFLDDIVEVTIHHNQFIDNDVSVNQSGGVVTLDSNLFQGGETCVRNWLADPTITNNVFRGCHTGIWHERSNSVFSANDMEDEFIPPGTGIIVKDTNSPVIEGNSIRNYGTGILVINATAYIRNNTIADNVGDGVRVEANTGPMDIAGNDIFDNGGDGVHLIDAQGVTLADNEILSNGGNGVYVEGAADVTLERVNASGNAIDGFRVATSPGAIVDLVEARAIGNAADGLRAGNGTLAEYGWWEGNGGAGVRNTDADYLLPAECGYWGSPSGPTTIDNPNGTGDEVVGVVDWSPFRTSPATTSCGTILLVIDG